ncbi:MAG: tol-pal system protein YbgF [Gammaproteobacteria bacterium]|nr:tol-pal system protein YbgF [Gammaproteobacteria bacterium]
MQNKLFKSAVLGLAGLSMLGWVQAEEPGSSKIQPVPVGSTEERLARLERMVNSRGLVDILLRLDSLQKDVQQVHGDSEVQLHQLEELKKRQRELYIDIDRRLLQLERKQGAGISSSAPANVLAPVEPVKSVDMPSTSIPAYKKLDPAPTEIVSGGKPTGSGVRSAMPESKPESPVETEQQSYQKAFDLLRELRYDKASIAFRDFINVYPDGRYAHIAQYWLAEASYAQRKFDVAIVDYQKLIDTYAGSPKRAEAMLKIGYSYYELKQYAKAQAILEQLLANYPGTTESGQAQNLLQKIKINNAS